MQEGTSIATCMATGQLAERVKRVVHGRADDPFAAGVPNGDGSQIAEGAKWPR